MHSQEFYEKTLGDLAARSSQPVYSLPGKKITVIERTILPNFPIKKTGNFGEKHFNKIFFSYVKSFRRQGSVNRKRQEY